MTPALHDDPTVDNLLAVAVLLRALVDAQAGWVRRRGVPVAIHGGTGARLDPDETWGQPQARAARKGAHSDPLPTGLGRTSAGDLVWITTGDLWGTWRAVMGEDSNPPHGADTRPWLLALGIAWGVGLLDPAGALRAEVERSAHDLRHRLERDGHRLLDVGDVALAGRCDCGMVLWTTTGALDAAGARVTCERVTIGEEATTVVGCGRSWSVRALRDRSLRSAPDTLATGAELARALDVDPGTLRKWVQRGRLDRRGTRPGRGRDEALYRIGDVIDLVDQARRRRAG